MQASDSSPVYYSKATTVFFLGVGVGVGTGTDCETYRTACLTASVVVQTVKSWKELKYPLVTNWLNERWYQNANNNEKIKIFVDVGRV